MGSAGAEGCRGIGQRQEVERKGMESRMLSSGGMMHGFSSVSMTRRAGFSIVVLVVLGSLCTGSNLHRIALAGHGDKASLHSWHRRRTCQEQCLV